MRKNNSQKWYIQRLLSLMLVAVILIGSLVVFPVTAHAAEAGSTMDSAVKIVFDSVYEKTWTPDTDHLNHYVEFTLTKQGIVCIQATKPFDDEGEYGRLYFTVYDEEGEPVWGNYSYESVNDAKSYYRSHVGLAPGTYYLTIRPGFSVQSGNVETEYSLTFEENAYCEIEPNSDGISATPMVLDQKYTGYFGEAGSDYDEADYYKFPVKAGYEYRIYGYNTGKIFATTSILKLSTPVENDTPSRFEYDMQNQVDSEGLSYADVKITGSGNAFLLLRNHFGAQYEYGFRVVSLTCKKNGHSYESWSIEEAATCTQPGVESSICSACGAKQTREVEALGHKYESWSTEEAATCTAAGTEARSCTVCSAKQTREVNALGHNWNDGTVTKEATCESFGVIEYTCTRCEETYHTEVPYRVYGAGRCETAIAVANELKDVLGISQFDTIIIANGDNFADALAGSYLAAQKNAPILLYRSSAVEMNLEYIQENLREDGIVYLLGGTAAVPANVEDGLKEAGIEVERLAGATRFDTNLEILKEVGISEDQEILVATGYNFADSLSASSTGLPILMVNNGQGVLTDSQIAFLESLDNCKFAVIGGTSAVSDALEDAISEYGEVTRLAGNTRETTSVLVAEAYFRNPEQAVLAYSRNFPDGLCGGPLAYALGAPLLLTNAGQETAASDYVADHSITGAVVLGGTSVLSDKTVNTVFGLE